MKPEQFHQPSANEALAHDLIENGENEVVMGRLENAVVKGHTREMEMLKGILERRIGIMKDYENGTAPTYVSYANIIDALLEKTVDSGDEEIETLRKLAEGRVAEMRSAVKRYVKNVVRYQHAHKRLMEHGEQHTAEFERVDHERRKTHETLIETLRTTGQVIAKLQAEARDTSEGVPLKAYPSGSGDKGGALIFESAFIDDRDMVRDWAIAAWTIDQVRKSKEKAASEDNG